MKLLTFRTPAGLKLGVKTAAGVVDVGALGVPGLPMTVEAVIAAGESGRRALEAEVGKAVAGGGNPAWLLAEESLEFAPCVPNPGKIICVGLNYRPHAEESEMAIPTTPLLFGKFNNTLEGHGQPVPIPPETEQMDYEAELAVVIGRQCRNVEQNEALQCVAGYCCANDVSARDLQFRTAQWLLGKSADGFCPLGPYLVTADEVVNPQALNIQCHINGELRQSANSEEMIFSCDYLISYISRFITLEPGDLILTGTPEGVALGRPDKPWLKAGDSMTVTIDGLGTLTNRLAAM